MEQCLLEDGVFSLIERSGKIRDSQVSLFDHVSKTLILILAAILIAILATFPCHYVFVLGGLRNLSIKLGIA